jgi:hypothetical protein
MDDHQDGRESPSWETMSTRHQPIGGCPSPRLVPQVTSTKVRCQAKPGLAMRPVVRARTGPEQPAGGEGEDGYDAAVPSPMTAS